MLVSSIGYLRKSSNTNNADIKKAQVVPYVNHYLNDINVQSFANNMNFNAEHKNSGSLIGKFLNLFA